MIQFHREEDYYMNKYSYRGIPLDIFYWQSCKIGWWIEDDIPDMPGLYAMSGFCSQGVWLGFTPSVEVIYIGQTNSLRKRLNSHELIRENIAKEYDMDIFRLSFLPTINTDKTFLLDVEKHLIHIYKPLHNKVHNKQTNNG